MTVPPLSRSSPKVEDSGNRVVEFEALGQRKREIESGHRSSLIWKCKFFPSEVIQKQLKDWHRTYMIPDNVEFIILVLNDWADDLPLGCVALNQVVLVAGLHFSFPRIFRKFLREWRIASTQLCPNGSTMVGFLILWDCHRFSVFNNFANVRIAQVIK
ncbi:hypothetical protein Adt_45716 [Abeliophyllum distichum]|uniref:Uncharacterized protein n=1 Tax=Abeliophyllum distichum TaxID=126358 RepID=A0ABD1PIB2_9LAMI